MWILVGSHTPSWGWLHVMIDFRRMFKFPMLLTYQSTSDAWTLMETSGGEGAFAFFPATNNDDVVVVNEFLYVSNLCERYLMALHMRTGVWRIACRLTLEFCGKLLQCGDRVLLGLFKKRGSYAFQIRVLDATACEMVFESAPRADVDPELARILDDECWKIDWQCQAYEGVLCIFSTSSDVGVVFEAATRVWRQWRWQRGDDSIHFLRFLISILRVCHENAALIVQDFPLQYTAFFCTLE